MEVPFTKRFEEQRRRYAFRFTCEDCAHFDPRDGSCLHEFPNEMHRRGYYKEPPRPATILFCKDFDLA